MKHFLALIIAFSCVAGIAKPKGKVKAKVQPKTEAKADVAKEEPVERFAELRLRGNLKRPELAYDFEDESKTSELPLTTPDDFNDELFRDVDK